MRMDISSSLPSFTPYSASRTERRDNPETESKSAESERRSSGQDAARPLDDPQVRAEIRKLAQRDREVRTHEQAHASVGGSYAGAPTYTFKRGPDGRNYAVGGEVSIDVSPVAGNPQATLRKMEIVRRAALAPAEPSPQDRQVAAEATQRALQARAELLQQQNASDQPGNASDRNSRAAQAYASQQEPASERSGTRLSFRA